MSARKKRRKTNNKESKPAPQPAPPSRAFWSGTITFGLVSIPVDFYPATRSRPSELRMVTPEGHPVGRRYVCPAHERPVSWEEIVRGFEVESGEFVVITDEELEAAAPEKTRDINLTRFVALTDLPPVLFVRPYILAPSGESTKAYRLLVATMEEVGQVGIASFVMRDKAYLVAIMAKGGVLVAETLRLFEEVRSPQTIGLPTKTNVARGRVEQVARWIDGLSQDRVGSDELTDEHDARLAQLAADKAKRGQDLIEAEGEAESENGEVEAPIDLMALLRQRLEKAEARPRPPAKTGPKREELEEEGKSELYARAQKLGIQGRSRMNKDDLLAAIHKAAS